MRLDIEFSGNELLSAELTNLTRKWKSGVVQAGFFQPKQATVANILEYGAPAANIPPRPFMRLSVAQQEGIWVNFLSKRLGKGDDTKTALEVVGGMMRLAISRNVLAGIQFTRNADRTIAKKGFNRPLWETGAMYRAVAFKVYSGKKYLRQGEEG